MTRLQQQGSWQHECHSSTIPHVLTNNHPHLPIQQSSHLIYHRWMGQSSSIKANWNPTMMGKYLSTQTRQQSNLVWGQTSCCGRCLLKEGGNFTLPWLTNMSWHAQFHLSSLFNMCTTMCQSHDWHLFISYLFLLTIVLHRWLVPSTLLWLSAGILIVLMTHCSHDIHCSSDVHCSCYSIVPIEYIVRLAR